MKICIIGLSGKLGTDRAHHGTKYVHIGDVGRTDNLLEIVRGAAALARDSGVQHLSLTHLSRRYSERESRTEARATFVNTHVARIMLSHTG